MRILKIVCITAVVAFSTFSMPAKAELLANFWDEFTFPVTDDSGCAGEDGMANGLVHITVTNFKKGGIGFHVNATGTWTGDISGDEYTWKDNVVDVLPIAEDGKFVLNVSQQLRIIGQGPGMGQFRLNFNLHIVEIGGELKTYVDELKTTCSV